MVAIGEWFSEVRSQSWKRVATWQGIVASGGFAMLVYLLKTDSDGFLPIIDHANLAFHEAGHVIFGLLGSTLGLYGGTLGQLVIPAIAAGTFWKQREPVGCAVAGVWFFQNFLNIARYMADAPAQLLPLVGGGDHDWTTIFGRWGTLPSDTTIATVVHYAGWLGMLFVWVWLFWRWKVSTTPEKPV
jgi:hypothetical protein